MMVIAVALAAIIKTTGAGAANAAYLRDKTFAHWVAMNQMAELQLAQTYPSLGEESGEEEMANRTWYWSRKVKTTPDEDIRRVEISVRLENNKDAAALTSVTGFFTKYVSREDDERRDDDEGRGNDKGRRNDKEEGKITKKKVSGG
jgi:general secretion pathway protein I